jgi:hypothetical protein
MIMIYSCLFSEIYEVEQHLEFGWYMCAVTCIGLLTNVGLMLMTQITICK